jgi:hypothetical protein
MRRLEGKKQTFVGLTSFLQLGSAVPRNLTLKGSHDINYACNYHNSHTVGLGVIRGLSQAIDAFFASTPGRVIIVPPLRCIETQASINGRIWPLETVCEYSWANSNRVNRSGGRRRSQPLHLFIGVLRLFIEVRYKVIKRSRSAQRDQTVLFAQIEALVRSSDLPPKHPNGSYTTTEGVITQNDFDRNHIIPVLQLHTYLHKITRPVNGQPTQDTPVVFLPIADAFPVPNIDR